MKIEKVLYCATAKATGGRDGSAKSTDLALNVQLSTPKELVLVWVSGRYQRQFKIDLNGRNHCE